MNKSWKKINERNFVSTLKTLLEHIPKKLYSLILSVRLYLCPYVWLSNFGFEEWYCEQLVLLPGRFGIKLGFFSLHFINFHEIINIFEVLNTF
jgi:hypothetical protein